MQQPATTTSVGSNSPGVVATTDSSGGLSGGAIAGIVVGSLVAAAILATGCFALGARKRAKKDEMEMVKV